MKKGPQVEGPFSSVESHRFQHIAISSELELSQLKAVSPHYCGLATAALSAAIIAGDPVNKSSGYARFFAIPI